jgi:hypothetical protein
MADSGCELGCFGSVLLTQNIGILNLVQVSTSLSSSFAYKSELSSFGWIQGGYAGKNGEGPRLVFLLVNQLSRSRQYDKHDPARSNSGTRSIGHYAGQHTLSRCPSSSIQDVVDLPTFCLSPLAIGRFRGESGDFFHDMVYLKEISRVVYACNA